MEVKNYFATDSQGNVLGSAQVYLYLAGTTTLATGLQNISGAALANPFTSQSNGLVQFKAPDADYDLRVVKPGREFTIRIQCFDGIAFMSTAVTYESLIESDGAERIGYESGNVGDVLYGSQPFGPGNQRVDQFTGSNSNPDIGGPFIKRPWCTTAPISIFIDPATGSDLNDGSLANPLRTITGALQRIPQNIYHKVRVYPLDGDYGTQTFRMFNHFISPRGSAGFRIMGHIANYDGENHPIYTDDNPDAVQINGFEHIFTGLSGSEEFSLSGMKFSNGWIEPYDTTMILYKCNISGGHAESVGNSTHHAFGGHNMKVRAILCNVDNVASLGSFTGFSRMIFEQCVLTNLNAISTSSVKGISMSVGDGSEVYIKYSPTLLDAGPNGKPVTIGSGRIYDIADYSPGGYPIIRRSTPARDERVVIVSHDGGSTSLSRGAGIELNAQNYATDPGCATVAFGPAAAAKAFIRYQGTSGSGVKNVAEFTTPGDVKVYGAMAFGANGAAIATLLNNGQGALWVNTNGDIRAASKIGGVTRWSTIFTYASGAIL